jgi:hypothetical protein
MRVAERMGGLGTQSGNPPEMAASTVNRAGLAYGGRTIDSFGDV